MAIAKTEFSNYIKAFKFRELFNEMGWNNDRTRQPIVVDDADFNLVGIAEKSGFRIFICEPAPGNKLPDKATRKKIERKLTKLFQEHLIIFIDEYKREQVWQLAVRKAGSPTKISETSYSISQDPELLYQRASGLFFTLDEEEKVTIIDVTKRVAKNFQQNNERVTKKFYESFKKEHAVFLKFIQGIDDQLHMDWYASLMLNRLMFCYFIQKKGFLDNNKNYLQDKLKACKEKKGKNKFYSFYRDFLLALFYDGLGAPEHTENLEVEIGQIPYLNGGLFDEHEIEKTFKKISIGDKAFEKLFDFFDQYEWHLDTRETASGKDINPDVIGYIFEKYINDRAQMGAYYTKEDITDYIAKNCIIPWLFDEVKRNYPNAFGADGWLWQMVKTSGDEYIYDAVKHGVPENGGLFDDLPAEVQKGFAPELENKVVEGKGPWLWELRKSWNKPASSDIALPTEIYREVIERRKRYADIKTKIESGEIKGINEFITCNLNIRQFAQDVVETTEDAEFIRHFYKALSSITILDPTCGSGAFLFAAMNILELLYEACIVRMKNFIDESKKGRHTFFEETLAQVNAPEHPNLQYFIYKSIILNNLYGVDIMNEAVEIAKLRLFLKLVATVDADYRKPNLGLEPLPDVDFNIRAGNTLVGYATEPQLKDAFAGQLDFDNDAEKIKEKCDIVGHAFARYKEIQLQGNADFDDFKQAKDDLNQRLNILRNELDVLLHKEHYANVEYDQWLATHQPFHWFAEFYEIINDRGGFDVVIGNPPYVEYSKVRDTYKIGGYDTEKSGNLYAYVMERVTRIIRKEGYFSFIILMASITTKRMSYLRRILESNFSQNFYINLAGDWHPGRLFDGVRSQFTIYIGFNQSNEGNKIYTTNYLRWNNLERDNLLLSKIEYVLNDFTNVEDAYPKFGKEIERKIWKKILGNRKSLICYSQKSGSHFYYRNAGIAYYQIVINFEQKFTINGKKSTSSTLQKWYCENKKVCDTLVNLLNSNIFSWYYFCFSDCYHLTQSDFSRFQIDLNELLLLQISKFTPQLMKCIDDSSILKITNYKTKGEIIYQEFYPRHSKAIIDEIDKALAEHYGFTHEELDFIINYDIKYRMGKELNSGEDNNG